MNDYCYIEIERDAMGELTFYVKDKENDKRMAYWGITKTKTKSKYRFSNLVGTYYEFKKLIPFKCSTSCCNAAIERYIKENILIRKKMTLLLS